MKRWSKEKIDALYNEIEDFQIRWFGCDGLADLVRTEDSSGSEDDPIEQMFREQENKCKYERESHILTIVPADSALYELLFQPDYFVLHTEDYEYDDKYFLTKDPIIRKSMDRLRSERTFKLDSELALCDFKSYDDYIIFKCEAEEGAEEETFKEAVKENRQYLRRRAMDDFYWILNKKGMKTAIANDNIVCYCVDENET